MTSVCAVMRKTGGSTTTNGIETPEWATVYASSPVRIAGAPRGGSGSRSTVVGGVEVALALRVANFPAGTVLRDNDLIEVTTGDLDGRVYRVLEGDWQDQATALRVPVVAERRPGEWA